MLTRTHPLVFSLLSPLTLALALAGCGGATSEGGGSEADTQGRLRAGHLPEVVRFARFGETTPEQVMAQFTADNLYVTDSVGRELRVHARGANTGRPYAYVNVTRRQDGNGYIGTLGDEYTLRFEFTNYEPGGPLVLFGIEISQPLSQPSVCAAAAELASGTGLEGCHPDSVYRPDAPDASGYYYACTSTAEAGYPIEVLCKASAGSTRAFRAQVTLGRVEETETAGE